MFPVFTSATKDCRDPPFLGDTLPVFWVVSCEVSQRPSGVFLPLGVSCPYQRDQGRAAINPPSSTIRFLFSGSTARLLSAKAALFLGHLGVSCFYQRDQGLNPPSSRRYASCFLRCFLRDFEERILGLDLSLGVLCDSSATKNATKRSCPQPRRSASGFLGPCECLLLSAPAACVLDTFRCLYQRSKDCRDGPSLGDTLLVFCVVCCEITHFALASSCLPPSLLSLPARPRPQSSLGDTLFVFWVVYARLISAIAAFASPRRLLSLPARPRAQSPQPRRYASRSGFHTPRFFSALAACTLVSSLPTVTA